MNVDDVVKNSIEMMEKVEKKTNEMKKSLDETLTITRKYREYIQTFHPEIHNKAVEYIKEIN